MRSKLTAQGAAVAAFAGAFILAVSPASAQYTQTAPTVQAAPQTTQTAMSSPMTGSSQSTATEPANLVNSPETKFASAPVQDLSGQTIGQVKSVKTTPGGKASSVAVSLSSGNASGKIVSINANKLRYDPNGNALKTSLTSSQIDALPATQSQ